MIKLQDEYTVSFRENMRGGKGKIKIEEMWDPKSELKANNRLFARITIEPGCDIGFHDHVDEEEVFVILKGEAEIDDNGEKVTLKPGDSILTGDGAGHAVKSVGDEALEMLAVISCY